MKDRIELGFTTPHGEPCAQVGTENYESNSLIEGKVMINQIIRQVGQPIGTCRFSIIKCPHDFGTYHDIAIRFEDERPEETNYVERVQNLDLENWDEIAIQELKDSGYTLIK
jgi:hypothetical protein